MRKKIISFITSMSMLISVCSTSVYANDTTVETLSSSTLNMEINAEDIISVFVDEELGLMSTTINQEDLITSIDNPRNGRISFYLTVPAETEVEWSVELIPHSRTGSIETSDGTITNSKDTASTYKVSVSTDYFSDKYVISASYEVGPAKNKYIYVDEDEAKSGVITDVYSEPFIWDEENLEIYNLGEDVSVYLPMGISAVVGLLASKHIISGKISSIVNVCFTIDEIEDTFVDGATDTAEIQTVPIIGWGYQIWFEPIGDGAYNRHLVVIDAYGDVYETHLLGTYYCEGVMIGAR